MSKTGFPKLTREMAERRSELAPVQDSAFHVFSKAVFQKGALPSKTKQLIAVAAAHITQCPYCIRGHTRSAKRAGASDEEVMEAIWVAVEMKAGAAFTHAAIALETLEDLKDKD